MIGRLGLFVLGESGGQRGDVGEYDVLQKSYITMMQTHSIQQHGGAWMVITFWGE